MPAVPLSTWIAAGALLAAVAVAAGAFGAHGLAERLEPRALGLWETAARYLMYAAFGLLAVGLAGGRLGGGAGVAGWSLLAGAALFSGTVAALALGAPRWLGAITPIGGVLLILGFVALAWSALRRAG
jgi:uncharacterized membrane protein YgdD (TMEM256/DUF423 family)